MSVIAQLQDILSHRPVKRKRAGWFCASRPAVRRTAAERAVLLAVDFTLPCGSTPFLWSYPKKGAFGRVRPRRLGGQKSRPVKVFCPAFLQKSGRGPGAAPLAARRSARNSLVLTKRRRGSKGEPSPGVPPLRAAPPPAAHAPPRVRRWTKERVVEDADPYGFAVDRACAGVCRPSTSAIQTQNDALRAAFSPFPRRGAPKFKSVRGADTLAVGHGRQRRVGEAGGAGTSVRRDQPKRFSLGLHPVSLGKTKEMGWNSSTR